MLESETPAPPSTAQRRCHVMAHEVTAIPWKEHCWHPVRLGGHRVRTIRPASPTHIFLRGLPPDPPPFSPPHPTSAATLNFLGRWKRPSSPRPVPSLMIRVFTCFLPAPGHRILRGPNAHQTGLSRCSPHRCEAPAPCFYLLFTGARKIVRRKPAHLQSQMPNCVQDLRSRFRPWHAVMDHGTPDHPAGASLEEARDTMLLLSGSLRDPDQVNVQWNHAPGRHLGR